MYICICKQITNKDIKEIKLKYPSLSVQELAAKLGLGSDCGTCLLSALEDSSVAAKSKTKIQVKSSF